ncbi:MAG: tetratricopeptide repeat protein, partial [Nannocystaceae bacterium]|nr:tetratricopeptide repeat protein [Nannocystaceae bacterium]
KMLNRLDALAAYGPLKEATALRQRIPMPTRVVIGLASLAATAGLVSWASPTPTEPPTPDPPAHGQPHDPLRARLKPVDVLLKAEHFGDARVALDAIPTQVWLDGDPAAQADERAMRADLALANNNGEKARSLLDSAVWLAVDGERYETVALHATLLATYISRDVSDKEAAQRLMDLAWSAILREGEPPHLVARYWTAVAEIERFSGRPKLELRAAKRAVQVLESTPQGPSTSELIVLGAAHLANGRPKLAKGVLERARRLGKDEPGVEVQVAPLLATIAWDLGEPDKAVEQGRRAVATSTQVRGASHPLTVEARAHLGLLLIEFEPSEAVTELEAVLKTYGAQRGLIASVARANLGMALATAGRQAEGEALLLQALADLDAAGTVPATDIAFVWGMLGDTRASDGQLELAANAYHQALTRLPTGADTTSLREDLEARRDALNAAAP